MGDVLAASDLVVSRAGASSLAEIMTLGVPAVLVTYGLAVALKAPEAAAVNTILARFGRKRK